MNSLDITAVRSQFHGLDEGAVLFDNAGGSQTLCSVVDRIGQWFRETNVQLGASYSRFTLAGHSPASIVAASDRQGIGIRYGDFYSAGLIESLGLAASGGVVRVSMAHDNTHDEVDRQLDALAGFA